jgi:uncharacterized membrane protein
MQDRIKKVIIWRIISTIVAILLTVAFFGEWSKSIEMVFVFTVVMTVLHYFFEKWWEKD